ncbi:hypothetical protein P3X46_006409 [Hevea brasiliensis]|uniref:Uncharacterized protein n=1 Tax=Hevea brasiliensis TaxID=3981 RepID=A0ABQ9MQL2_HEVBR|nr:uncharacterized protein LOC110641340 [Hevea brasiliensis]KAJ9182411.1 hypothetical protein P3X46_006409 [Hevea brasiliensis]
MNSKHNQIRVLGQRSIPSSFTFRSSNLAKNSKDDSQKKVSNKDLSISLSDFLDRKLHTDPVRPKIVKGKLRPFMSPLGPRDDGGAFDHWIGIRKEGKERNSVIDEVVFEQFKHASAEKGDGINSCGVGGNGGEIGTSDTQLGIGSFHAGDLGTSNSNNDQVTRKRRNPFEDGDEKHAIRKHSLVLGGDSEPKQRTRLKKFISNKKPRPFYNHYANGCGWWDCDMEGVDTEEVGTGEIWEGVGSTTFGGI